jgi:hypothetical protein
METQFYLLIGEQGMTMPGGGNIGFEYKADS